MERLQSQLRVNSLFLVVILAFAVVSCGKPQGSAKTVSDLLGDFTSAYFDFYYVKSNPAKSAKEMKYVFSNVSDLIQDKRIEFYVQVFLLCYRLDGEILHLLREAIVGNGDKKNLKEYVALFRKELYHPRDKEQIKLLEMFIASITE